MCSVVGSGVPGSPCHCVLHWPTEMWSDEADTPVHCRNKTCCAAAIVISLDSHTQENGICHLSIHASVASLALSKLQGFGGQNKLEYVATLHRLTSKAHLQTSLLHALSNQPLHTH